MSPVSSNIVEKFRGLAIERLGRVQAAWRGLARGEGGREAAAEISRVVHTVKGDARVVGFADVHLVCDKLEDLLALFAAARDDIPADLERLVSRAIEVSSQLVRDREGAAAAGIDLAGLIREVDEMKAKAREKRFGRAFATRSADTRASLLKMRAGPVERLSAGAQYRLAAGATLVFLEHLNAAGDARAKLLAGFGVVAAELSRLGQVPVGDLFKPHVVAAGDLAQRLGKQVRITSVDELAPGISVPMEIAGAVDAAVFHCLRNAIDHGIEMPTERRVRGKPEAGRIDIAVALDKGTLAIDITDDGAGSQGVAVRMRGDGFDAVENQLAQVGGEISITASIEAGTRACITLPVRERRLDVLMFSVPGIDIPFAVDKTWAFVAAAPGAPCVDLACALGLAQQVVHGGARPVSFQRGGAHPLSVTFAMRDDPKAATAKRIAVTADDQVLEVVRIAGAYALLVRPERVQRRV